MFGERFSLVGLSILHTSHCMDDPIEHIIEKKGLHLYLLWTNKIFALRIFKGRREFVK